MKKLLLVITFISLTAGLCCAQKRTGGGTTKGVAVAFWDDRRIDQTSIQDFQFFFEPIQEIIKRDFPGVEFKVLKRGELLNLPDGTGLNVDTLHPEIGFVLSARGKKRRMLSGIQSDADFACAAVAFFRQPSSACPKIQLN
jgi:hypothetical protein